MEEKKTAHVENPELLSRFGNFQSVLKVTERARKTCPQKRSMEPEPLQKINAAEEFLIVLRKYITL